MEYFVYKIRIKIENIIKIGEYFLYVKKIPNTKTIKLGIN